MKNLLALLFAFAFAATSFSQELWLDETDDFTGESKKATRREVIGDNGEEKNTLKFQ